MRYQPTKHKNFLEQVVAAADRFTHENCLIAEKKKVGYEQVERQEGRGRRGRSGGGGKGVRHETAKETTKEGGRTTSALSLPFAAYSALLGAFSLELCPSGVKKRSIPMEKDSLKFRTVGALSPCGHFPLKRFPKKDN